MPALRKAAPANPIVETLAARVQAASGDTAAALRTYGDALKSFPGYRALIYDYAEALLADRQPDAARRIVENRLQYSASDYRLYQLQAKSYAALNMRLPQHRALAEYHYRLGNVQAAIEQLLIAQKSGDGDFYQLSSVDARLRELRTLDDEMRKDKDGSGKR